MLTSSRWRERFSSIRGGPGMRRPTSARASGRLTSTCGRSRGNTAICSRWRSEAVGVRRRQLIEIEDQSWCPAAVRDGLTDYLQFITDHTEPYAPAARLFHHFPPEMARRVLADAVARGHAIAVFESTARTTLCLILMLLVPHVVWLVTPFIRPFRWSR